MASPAYSVRELFEAANRVLPEAGSVNYGTGELACNPGTDELVLYVARNFPSVSQSLTTNGYSVLAFPKRVLRCFHDVDVSVDFPDPDRQVAFRGHPSAWEWAVKALELLRAEGIPRTVVTCVTAETTDEDIVRLVELAARYGAYWRASWFRRMGRGGDGLRLRPRRAWEVVALAAGCGKVVALDSVFAAPLGLGFPACPAGRNSLRIHEDGSVSPYTFLKGGKWSAGSVYDPGFDLRNALAAFAQLRERKPEACAPCPFWNACGGGCLSRAVLHGGSPGSRDDYCYAEAGMGEEELRALGARIRRSEAELVHAGYLCTMIVDPN